mgnify:CR=1 FL=1
MEKKDNNEIHSETVKAGANKVFYLSLRKTQNDDLFFSLSEIKNMDNGRQQKNTVMVFENNMKDFITAFRTIIKKYNDMFEE